MHPSRVLTAHRQREKDQSELTAASGVVGGEGCSSGSEVSGLEGEVGSRHRFWEHLPLLTQQQLEATFISTADFLVSWSSEVIWSNSSEAWPWSGPGLVPLISPDLCLSCLCLATVRSLCSHWN